MDIFSHLFVVKKLCAFEKMNINEKEAQLGPFFIKKKLSVFLFNPIAQDIFEIVLLGRHCCAVISVTSKKSPNVYKIFPKMISMEKLKILTP